MAVSSHTIMIAIGIYLGFFSVALCLKGDIDNVCDGRTSRGILIPICCAYYEEIEDRCVGCNEGFTSQDGEQCRECPGDSYGIRCSMPCSCSEVQRCDNIDGCVDLPQQSFTTLTSLITTENYSTTGSSTQGNRSDGNNGGVFSNQAMVYYIAGFIVVLMAVGMCFLFAKYRKLHTNQRLFSRNGDSSNVNEQAQVNDNIYIYDEINDLDLDESHEMDTTNNLNHEITNAASIIDIDESNNTNYMGYEMPSKSTKGDNNTNGIVRNSPTLAEDDNSLKLDQDSGYLNPYQPLAASFRLNSNERSSCGAYSNLYEPLKRNWKSLSFEYEIPPNKYVGEVCTSAKVSSTDRGMTMIFSVTTEQCSTGTDNGVGMMKRQLKCNSAPNLQIKIKNNGNYDSRDGHDR